MDWLSVRAAIEAWRDSHWLSVAGPAASRWTHTLSPFVPDVWPPDGAGRVTAYLGAYRADPALEDAVMDIAYWAAMHVDVQRPDRVHGEIITPSLVELGPRGLRPLDGYEQWLVDREDAIELALVTASTTEIAEIQAPMLREYYRMWVALNPRDALFIQPRHAVFFEWLGPGGTVERISQHYYALREWFYERARGSGAIVDPRQRLTLHLADQAVAVSGQHFLLGRSPECDLVLPGNGVSREHATITYTQGTFWLHDLGSSFGTQRDGAPVGDRAELLDGTVITIGANQIRCDVQPINT